MGTDSASSEGRRERLRSFVAWVGQNCVGDEKGEAQLYLDHLFRAFGHVGLKEAGASLEVRVKKGDAKGTAFADLVWKPIVLIEMKRRGEDLRRHYRQAFDYWTRLVPGRPRYVILCNFDEFWIYDFESQMDSPVDRVALAELPERDGALAFLYGTPEKPVFGNNREAVTREAAAQLAACFTALSERGVERTLAQRFVLQTLVALFSEDIGLLEKYMVARLLDDCSSPSDAYDLLGGLFTEMNTPGRASGGRYKGVDYFNGGVFAKPARVELELAEINLLRGAAVFDWGKVSPEIFGTIFEHSLEAGERHAFGAHYTSLPDIMKIVGPTISDPWRELVENASTRADLLKLRDRLHHFTVLDPACGSGNFLYVAYRELKRIEARLYERLQERSRKTGEQGELGFLTAANLYGIDINPFAIELAKVTMMLGRKLAIDELHITESPLPLDNLDANFSAADALIDSDGNPRNWPSVDAIIGNPPFLGAKRLKPERGDAYVNALRRAYPEVPGMADYCVYWFRKAHERLRPSTSADPLTGRAGLVGTQNVRNNKSRKAGLDYITATGTIVEAVDNQPWSGDANVHVSIVNWVKTTDPALVPGIRRIWHVVPQMAGPLVLRESTRASRRYDLAVQEVPYIAASLAHGADVSAAHELRCNVEPQVSFQGVIPGYDGFVVTLEEREAMLAADPLNAEVVRPYAIGRDLLSGDGQPSRAVIDFGSRNILEARAFERPFAHVQANVMPEVLAAAEKAASTDMADARNAHAERWWQFWNVRTKLRQALQPLQHFLACSRVTKRPIFSFVSTTVVPDCALQVFALEDDYSFGILQSTHHWHWFTAKCSKLKADFRYTPESVFNTFPWPQSPSGAEMEEVAQAAAHLRALRDAAATSITGGLRDVYRTVELPGANPIKAAQSRLDASVNDAYGFQAADSYLAQLLDLNDAVAAAEREGAGVRGPEGPQRKAQLVLV